MEGRRLLRRLTTWALALDPLRRGWDVLVAAASHYGASILGPAMPSGGMRTCVRVSIKGRPYTWFHSALKRGDLLGVRAAPGGWRASRSSARHRTGGSERQLTGLRGRLHPFYGYIAAMVVSIYLLLLVIVVMVVIALVVAGVVADVGPFARRKAQTLGYSDADAHNRPQAEVPHREQPARDQGETVPPRH